MIILTVREHVMEKDKIVPYSRTGNKEEDEVSLWTVINEVKKTVKMTRINRVYYCIVNCVVS